MPQEPEHGSRFARDMRRIREARNLSVGDLHDETKIPRGLIEAFEDRALFDHPQFNRVYLRSFVRTYAQVVDIDAEVALEGLEEALSGRYMGSLAVAYLGEKPEELAVDDRSPEAGESDAREETAEADVPDRAMPDEPERGNGKTEGGPERRTSRREREPVKKEREEDDEATASFVSTTHATAAGIQQSKAEREEVEGDESEDWTAQSPPPGTASGAASRQLRRDGPDRRWILGGALVVVAAGLVWILVSVIGSSEGQAPPAVSADTVGTTASPETTRAAPVALPVNIPTLGDTMTVRIVAAHGKVDPIRVTVDDDLRRPYWIERGDSMTFEPTSRIVIEELLDSVDVSLEGIEYPTSRLDEQGRIVITRDGAQSYFASLRQSE